MSKCLVSGNLGFVGGAYKPWAKYTRPVYGHTNFRWHPLSKERGEG